MVDYQVQMIHFPNGKVNEVVTKNEDGSYTIFIEDTLNKEEKQKKFLHAMKHISDDDFDKANIHKIELDAHKVS